MFLNQMALERLQEGAKHSRRVRERFSDMFRCVLKQVDLYVCMCTSIYLSLYIYILNTCIYRERERSIDINIEDLIIQLVGFIHFFDNIGPTSMLAHALSLDVHRLPSYFKHSYSRQATASSIVQLVAEHLEKHTKTNVLRLIMPACKRTQQHEQCQSWNYRNTVVNTVKEVEGSRRQPTGSQPKAHGNPSNLKVFV